MNEIDSETLSRANGKEGSPVYIAYKGRVVDVSKSKLWQTGLHMRRHSAGTDLTTDIEAAPHGPEVLDRYPVVGSLKPATPREQKLPSFLNTFLSRHPFFRRHPHPATVHFPIAFMSGASGFYLLYLLTRATSFEITGFYSTGAAILCSLIAMATGLYTWWVNYMARPLRQVTIKIILSCIMLADSIVVFTWRYSDPYVAASLQRAGILYLVLTLLLGPVAIIIGYYGGTLTFPLEKK